MKGFKYAVEGKLPAGSHRMSAEEVLTILHGHMGHHVRLTYQSGEKLIGVVGAIHDDNDGQDYTTVDGRVMLHYADGVVLVEVREANGRYQATVRESARRRTVRDDAGQGMHIGWMDAYVYNADLYCEDCGRAVQKELDAEGGWEISDSTTYPQGPYPDGGGESDSPQHCGSGAGCVNVMEFAGTKVGVWLGNPLTRDGVDALKEMLSNPRPNAYQLALHEFWSSVYSDYLGGWVPSPLGVRAPGRALPGVRSPRIAESALRVHHTSMGWYVERGPRDRATPVAGPFGTRGEAVRKRDEIARRSSVRSPTVRDYEGMSFEQWLAAARSHHDAHVRDDSVARMAYARGIDPHQFVEMYGGFALEEGGGGLLAVRLDDPRFPGNGGVVVAHVKSAAEFEKLIARRDGARDPNMRLWRGDAPVGTRVGIGPEPRGGALEETSGNVQAGGVNFHVNFQRGERLRIRIKGPEGQPLEAFWYTVDNTMSLNEVALQFAQTNQPGVFIEIVSGKLKWAYRVERHAGQPAVARVRGTYTREGRQ